jgi:hypothetical protein
MSCHSDTFCSKTNYDIITCFGLRLCPHQANCEKYAEEVLQNFSCVARMWRYMWQVRLHMNRCLLVRCVLKMCNSSNSEIIIKICVGLEFLLLKLLEGSLDVAVCRNIRDSTSSVCCVKTSVLQCECLISHLHAMYSVSVLQRARVLQLAWRMEHCVSRQVVQFVLLCCQKKSSFAHEAAICHNPHNLSYWDSHILDSWVANTPSVKVLCPQKKLLLLRFS